MKIRTLLFTLAGLLCIFALIAVSLPSVAAAQVDTVTDSIKVLQDSMGAPDRGVPPSVLKASRGLVIVPGIYNVAFLVGGRYGEGVVLVKNARGGWSAPALVSLAGGSAGAQAGVEKQDLILVFMDEKPIQDLLAKGSFTLGAEATAVAGPVQWGVGGATPSAEVLSYTRSKGVFAGAQFTGIDIDLDSSATIQYYESPAANPRAILEGKSVKMPPTAKELQQVLQRYEALAR